MASESRRVMGILDAAQAITGHHSIKMIEHYAKMPTLLQGETVSRVGDELNKSWQRLEQLPVIQASAGIGWENKKSSENGAF